VEGYEETRNIHHCKDANEALDNLHGDVLDDHYLTSTPHSQRLHVELQQQLRKKSHLGPELCSALNLWIGHCEVNEAQWQIALV